MNLLKLEIGDFSKWFRYIFFITFFVYISSWFFTIYLSGVQISEKLEPVLPVATMDSTEYRNLAESFLSGKGFSQFGYINTLQSPGYPFFIAFLKYITGSYFSVTLVQVILVFLSAIFIRKLGILFYSKNVGEIAATFFILNPIVLVLSLDIMTDVLFLFLFILGFYLATNNRPLFASFVFAVSIYVRPMGIFALPIFIAPFLVQDNTLKNKIKIILIMVTILLITISPWVYRNYRLTGVADFSSFKSANLSLYAAPMFSAYINKTDVETEKKNLEKTIKIPISNWRDLKFSKEVSSGALKIILDKPFSYLKYHIISSISFLFPSSIQYALEVYKQAMHIPNPLPSGSIKYLISGEWKLFLDGITATWWKMAERFVLFIMYIFMFLGIWKERNKKVTLVLVFIPLYLMLLAGPLGNARYSVQSLPFKLILFGVGFAWLIHKIRNKNVQK